MRKDIFHNAKYFSSDALIYLDTHIVKSMLSIITRYDKQKMHVEIITWFLYCERQRSSRVD